MQAIAEAIIEGPYKCNRCDKAVPSFLTTGHMSSQDMEENDFQTRIAPIIQKAWETLGGLCHECMKQFKLEPQSMYDARKISGKYEEKVKPWINAGWKFGYYDYAPIHRTPAIATEWDSARELEAMKEGYGFCHICGEWIHHHFFIYKEGQPYVYPIGSECIKNTVVDARRIMGMIRDIQASQAKQIRCEKRLLNLTQFSESLTEEEKNTTVDIIGYKAEVWICRTVIERMRQKYIDGKEPSEWWFGCLRKVCDRLDKPVPIKKGRME